jgi:DNA-binding beta-propeller fold protein YncE
MAVDARGNLFVADTDNKQVLELPAGWPSATEVAFNGLKEPTAVAVDTTGNVYVVDSGNNRVVKLPAKA